MAIVEEFDIEKGSEVEQSLRGIITKWADNIPYHPYRNFGEKINISSITYAPIFLLDCWTQFYSVADFSKERPYGYGFTYKDKNAEIPHDYVRESYEKHVERYCLPGSEEVYTCGTCHGSGKCTCSTCSGKGNVRCNNCNGSGSCGKCSGNGKIKCNNCFGSGRSTCSGCGGSGGSNQFDSYKNEYYFQKCNYCGGSGKANCSFCMGSGSTKCWDCYGSGRCRTCNGHGTIKCGSCGGSGKITCTTCNGDGRMISYIERVEKWDFRSESIYVFSPNLGAEFERIPLKSNTTTEFVSENYGEPLDDNLYSSEPEHFQKAYQGILQRASDPGGLDLNGDKKILDQYTSTRRIPAHYVLYNYEGQDYELMVLTKDEDVYEEKGPITAFRKQLINNAHHYLKRKQFGKSLDIADQAVSMGLDTNDPLLEKIHKKVKQKIKSIYKIGAFAGAWIAVYFVSLVIINSLKAPKYFLNIFNEKVANSGSNFLLFNNIILISLIAVISIINSVKLAGKKMHSYPGPYMKPEGMRFAMGFVTAFFYTIIVAFIFLFLNYTGVLLIITKLFYLLVHLIFPHLI